MFEAWVAIDNGRLADCRTCGSHIGIVHHHRDTPEASYFECRYCGSLFRRLEGEGTGSCGSCEYLVGSRGKHAWAGPGVRMKL